MKSLFTLLLILSTISIQAQQPEHSSEEIHGMAVLDKYPEFPGGNFQAEVVKRFVIPEIDQDMNVRLYISFIVERDGSISNIKCERNPGFGLCMAGEKALKEITAKWKPGIKDGVPVRVSYVLPIVINIKADTPPQNKN